MKLLLLVVLLSCVLADDVFIGKVEPTSRVRMLVDGVNSNEIKKECTDAIKYTKVL